MDVEVWDENLYKNWVRGAKGLEILQEGLTEFVGDKALECWDQHLRKITKVPIGPLPQCIQCTSENLLPQHANPHKACNSSTCIHRIARNCFGSRPRGRSKCPNGICSELYDAIVNDHSGRDPLWQNTDRTPWCSDPQGWSYAKCFEATRGPGTSAHATDASGLLSVIINNLPIQNWLACPNMDSTAMDSKCPFYKARNVRNEILHKSKLQLDDHTFDEYIDTFITVLEDPKCLLSYAGSQDAVQKLQQLKSKQIHISQMDEENILEKHKEALAELKEIKGNMSKGTTALDKKRADALQEMSDERNKASEEIKGNVSKGITALDTKRADALQEMSDERNKASEEIKGNVSKGITAFDTKRTDVLQEMSDERNKASEEIKGNISRGITAFDTKRTNASQEMCDERNKASEEIKGNISKGITALDTKRVDALQEMSDERNKASEEIKGNISEGITALDAKRADALQDMSDTFEEIKNKISTGLSGLNTNSADVLQKMPEERNEALEEIKETLSAQVKTPILRDDESYRQMKTRPHSAKVETPTVTEDEAYHTMKTQLQDDLIESYRYEHSTIILAPLANENCTPLLPFYVMPDIQTIKIKRSSGVEEEERTPVKTFRTVFNSGNNVLRKLYLTADAGLGKTAFCKRLALTWCQAKKHIKDENNYFSEEEIEVLGGFDFMFLLMLRDSSEECDIDDMILNQLVLKLANSDDLKMNDLRKITKKESCLVILDGLDEWTHSSATSCKPKHGQIPFAKARKWTILTTTRPWKLSLSGVSSCQIDQRLEITGLSPESANKLKRSVIAHLYEEQNENKLEQYVNAFNSAVKVKHVSDLEAVPLLLTYMLFLWLDDERKIGQSLCEVYSNIIELLLSRTHEDKRPDCESTQDSTPQCFSENELCRQFYTILTKLGHLAFQTLFRETREENTLVFASSVAKEYLKNDQCLKFCLKTGIITQSKIPLKLLKQQSKVSFAHKTIQEFFAALYISSMPNQTSMPKTVLSKCKCVKDILEMSKSLIFLSGLNVNASFSISRELMTIINEDEITREYRSSCRDKSEPLKQFQNICVSCCKESHGNEVSLCLQDVFINDVYPEEKYYENLKHLTARNTQNIRSLLISMPLATYSSAQEVIEYFALSDLENIEKIYYTGEYNDCDILPLLNTSVKSLSLLSRGCSWSVVLYEKVTRLHELVAITINRFVMSHGQLTLLCDYISQRHCMREITLDRLPCTDHKRESCSGCSLDLSQHSQLKEIKLWDIPVSGLKINMSSLEECVLGQLSNPDLELHFINCVPTDSKVKRFICRNLKSSAAIETIQQTLPLLAQVKQVVLWEINLGNKEVLTSEIIKNVQLLQVTMPASVLHGIVTVLQRLPQNVTVYVASCNITPENEFVTVKEEIKQSSKFRVMADKEHWLQFEKIKDGD